MFFYNPQISVSYIFWFYLYLFLNLHILIHINCLHDYNIYITYGVISLDASKS